MAKRRKRRRSSKINRKTVSAIIIIAVVVAGLFVASKTVYKCDSCGKTNFGAGYEPNIIEGKLSEEERICESCAKEDHKLALGLGTNSLEEFKLPIYWFGSGSSETTK